MSNTNRRDFLKAMCLGAVASSLPGCMTAARTEQKRPLTGAEGRTGAADKRPNIVLIMADDMGYSDAGCYGGEIKTPNIDGLAAPGLRFTTFYNNAICGPTRASLLTGLHCQQTGHSGASWNQRKDFSKCVTISEVLQDAGYHTMMVGKWQGRDLAVKRGFDRFFGPGCQGRISYFNEVRGNRYRLNDKPWTFPKEGFFMTDAFSDYAVRFLEEAVQGDKPFFMYAAYVAPHWPLHARERDIAPYRTTYRNAGWTQHRKERFERQQRMGLIPNSWRLPPVSLPDWPKDKFKDWQAERMSVYAAQISCMDRGIGRILDVIKRAGAEDNTLVMFLSDNGAAALGGNVPYEKADWTPGPGWRLDGGTIRSGSGPGIMPGPHDTFAACGPAWACTSNTPFRNYKFSCHEGGIVTPLVARWPAVIKKDNGITRQFGHVIDLMATCLDVAGVKYPVEFKGRKPLPMEGRSLFPIFKGEQREGHEVLCWNTGRSRAIRMGRWKLVNGREFYDLEVDGTETNNLAAKHPDRVKQMAERYAQWVKHVG